MASDAGAAGGNWIVGFGSLGVVRQLGLMVGLAASVAIGFAIVLWSQEPDYRVLYSNIDFADANTAIEQLNTAGIPYSFDAQGRAILVPADRVHDARLRLAAEGFTADKTVGFELLDQDQGLASSQFLENARYRRGLEGELARTISSLVAVRTARVHLAIPKESVFVRDQRQPRASVFLDLVSGRMLESDQVAAIANLVASSIADLDVRDVTVVDQRGRLLNTRDADEDVVLAARQLEYSRSIEETLLNRVNSILQPVVGLGRFRAEVSADVDFTQIEQADEIYNPDLPALRSEQTLEEVGQSPNGASGVPGALSNQPPGVAAAPEQVGIAGNGLGTTNASNPSREQATRNYELDRSVSYTRHQSGQVSRLTVAVVVDDVITTNANGEQTRTEWSQEDLDRLRMLVENAVGYKAVRGDSVSVVNSSFIVEEESLVLEEPPIWEQEWVWDAARQLAAAIFVLVLVLGVLRPIMRNLATQGGGSGMGGGIGPAGDISAELDGLDDSSGDKVTFSSGSGGMMPTPNESYEYQVNAIRSMVAEDPAKVAQAVRQWVADRD
ncbi:MAG: flagellar M-ring protein FliF [Oceanospirillaceae bacterium]|nr:flagellar M-ring protein FliF [Oceanospirillaceae bacterium]